MKVLTILHLAASWLDPFAMRCVFEEQMTQGSCLAMLDGLAFVSTAKAEREGRNAVPRPFGSIALIEEAEAAKGVGWRGFMGFLSRAVSPSRISEKGTEILV